jgi:hypothetical protein
MAQLPLDSQEASTSHVAPLLTGDTWVPGLAPTRCIDGRAGVTTSWAPGTSAKTLWVKSSVVSPERVVGVDVVARAGAQPYGSTDEGPAT